MTKRGVVTKRAATRHSVFYVCFSAVILDVTKRRGETAREKARGNTNGLSQIPSVNNHHHNNLTNNTE